MGATDQNDWLLLITEEPNEQEIDREAIIQAGWPDGCIVTASADEAADLLSERLHSDDERPGIIIVDLDHAKGENRRRLKTLMKALKEDVEQLRTIPLIMLVRVDKQEDTNAWYRAGVNAVAMRPNNPEAAVAFYKSLRSFWREHVILPNPEWPY